MSQRKQEVSRRRGKKIDSVAVPGTLPALRAGPHAVVSSKDTMGKIYSFDLTIIPLTFGLASGAAAARTQLLYSLFPLIAKFQAAFQEFRFRGIRLVPRIVLANDSGTTAGNTLIPGYIGTWIDETILSTSNPTATDMLSRSFCNVPIDSRVDPDKRRELQWTASDVEDLDWVSLKTSAYTTFVPATLCAYAAAGFGGSGTGTTATTNATLMLTGAARVEFRGLVSS